MENLPKNREIVRPEGAREDDFNDLSDAAIVELYSNSRLLKNDADKQNVEAEFERRNTEGALDKDFKLGDDYSPRAFMDEMLSHGYSIDEEGGIHYPTPEYKAWANSDRSKPAPRGIIRETIEERAEREADEAIEREYGTRDDYIVRAKKAVRFPSGNEGLKKEREEKDKMISVTRKADREQKEYAKTRTGKEGNMPLAQVETPVLESKERDIEPSEKRIGNASEKVSNLLDEFVEEYYVEGAINSFSEGDLSINPAGFVKESFKNIEAKKLKGLLGSEKEFGDFMDGKGAELVNDKLAEWNSEENVKKAEHDTIISAIAYGAKTVPRGVNVMDIQTLVPIDKCDHDKLADFMNRYDVDLKSEEARSASYNGFANIIDRIVVAENNNANREPETAIKDGFKALDWYFDNFNYADGFAEENGFLDNIYAYKATAGKQWGNMLDAYLKTRPEYVEFAKTIDEEQNKESEPEPKPKPSEFVPVNLEKYKEELVKKCGVTMDQLDDVIAMANCLEGLYYRGGKNSYNSSYNGQGNGTERSHLVKPPETYGAMKELAMYAAQTILIKSGLDKDAQIFTNRKDGEPIKIGETQYTVLRFGCGNTHGENKNHAIAESNTPVAATYVWEGHGDEWTEVFYGPYRSYVRSHPAITVKNHISPDPIDHLMRVFEELGVDLRGAINTVRAMNEDTSAEDMNQAGEGTSRTDAGDLSKSPAAEENSETLANAKGKNPNEKAGEGKTDDKNKK